MVAISFGFGAVAAEGWAGGGCEESRHIRISSYEFRGGGREEAEYDSSRVECGQIFMFCGISAELLAACQFRHIDGSLSLKFRLRRRYSTRLCVPFIRIVLSNNCGCRSPVRVRMPSRLRRKNVPCPSSFPSAYFVDYVAISIISTRDA